MSYPRVAHAACESVIKTAISQSGLPLDSGVPWLRDEDLGWSGRRTDSIPEGFFAHVHVLGKKIATGFYIEIGVYGYGTGVRANFAAPYWGKTYSETALRDNQEDIAKEIKESLLWAWNDLPRLYEKALQDEEEKRKMLDRLRAEGKLVE